MQGSSERGTGGEQGLESRSHASEIQKLALESRGQATEIQEQRLEQDWGVSRDLRSRNIVWRGTGLQWSLERDPGSLERDPGAESGEGLDCSGHLREIRSHLNEIQEQSLERDWTAAVT